MELISIILRNLISQFEAKIAKTNCMNIFSPKISAHHKVYQQGNSKTRKADSEGELTY